MKTALHLIDGIGLWAERRAAALPRGRPALFLDRDGVVVEEVHFLSRKEDVRLTPGIVEAIGEANAAGLGIVIVTNQSGIARGHFGWEAFAEVQDRLMDALARAGAVVHAVFACGYHGEGKAPLDQAHHPWRKPGPGMLLQAHDMLGTDLARSTIVGDRVSDLEAGVNAGLAGGTLVMTGYGREQTDAFYEAEAIWRHQGFSAATAPNAAAAISRFLCALS